MGKKNKTRLCCVRGCRNGSKPTLTYSNPDSNETLHSFPINKYRRLQWSNAVGRPEAMDKKQKLICSLHFDEGSIVQCKKSQKRRVLPDAVPTIFPEYDPNAEATTSEPKKKRNRKSANKSPKNSDYESDNRNSDYVSDNRNTDYESDEGNKNYGSGYGEYISESNMSYISTSGKRSNPLQPIRSHYSPHSTHMPSLDPWGADYDGNNYEIPQQSPRPHYQSPRSHYQSPRPHHQLPRPHHRVKTILTPPRAKAKKKVRRSVHFEDPAQAALRELREQRAQEQMQFSLMSFAPIEIDQSTSFAAPADDEIQDVPQSADVAPPTPSTPVKRTVDSSVAAEVYKKELETLQKKYRIERERAITFKKKYIAADLINRRNIKKILEMTATITKLKKQVAVPVFTLKDKNIRLTFS